MDVQVVGLSVEWNENSDSHNLFAMFAFALQKPLNFGHFGFYAGYEPHFTCNVLMASSPPVRQLSL